MMNHQLQNKVRVTYLKKEASSLSKAQYRPEYTIAAASKISGSLDSDHNVIDALLPLVSDEYWPRPRRTHSHGLSHVRSPLDYLAAIANEQARYDAELEETTSDPSDDTNNDENNDESDEYGEDEDENAYDGTASTGHSEVSAEALHVSCRHYTSREADAAAALLMASFTQHCKPPGKRKRRRVKVDEGGWLRSRRLSQNQLYRKRLHDKGVYPVRQGPRRYACSLCLEVFVKEMFVWRHGAKHLESKPFQCSLCSGKFNRSDSLQRHVRNFHHKE